MSLPNINGRARIIGDPRRGVTTGGTIWANVTAKFVNWRKDEGGWQENGGIVVTLCGFDTLARALVEFARGDEVAVDGWVRELSVWTPPGGGAPRPSLSITLTNVQPAGKGPRGGKRNSEQGTTARPATPQQPPRPPAQQPGRREPQPAGATVLDFRRTAADRLRRAHQSARLLNGGDRAGA